MSLVALSQQDDYELAHSEQDCRRWPVSDASGKRLGTCTDMVVDTEIERVDALVLDNGTRIPASNVTLQNGTVLVRGSAGTTPPARPGTHDETVVPVVEEHIKVGKRNVAGGGVRITEHVTERPVEETVTLRDEQVRVDRRPVDRDATAAEMTGRKDDVIEVTETDEEAVVSKRARVVEEVVVDKDVVDREETVRDTVRRTDVDVQKVAADKSSTAGRPRT